MSAARLVIKKRMLLIQGKVRPCCHVQALVTPDVQAALDEYFQAEALFKRAAYAQTWPKGAIEVPAAIAPALTNFLKNDACPEITVKTITAGQMHQGANVWEMMAFEFVAKLAFDNFSSLVQAVQELNKDVSYYGALTQAEDAYALESEIADLRRAATEMAA